MTKSRLACIAALLILSGCSEPVADKKPSTANSRPAPYIPQEVLTTQHFSIHTSATEEQTASVGTAVEALHRSYMNMLGLGATEQKFTLVLYRDQAEFKKQNRSAPWAEAYYKRPYSFAYPGSGQNPYHWMLHEVAHQLLTEASGYKLKRWLNEGMAGYLGSSKFTAGQLQLGEPDSATYPIWWLGEVRFDQSSEPNFSGSQMPSLQQLIEETGPQVSENVNSYYIAWWSLVHYLMQGDGGTHRDGTLKLLGRGGDPKSFQTLIGSYADIEPRWHLHLRGLTTAESPATGP